MTERKPIESILVAVDLTPAADRALAHAAGLAQKHGSKLTVLYVVEWLESWWSPMKLSEKFLDSLRQEGLRDLEAALARSADQPVEVEPRVEFGIGWQVILEVARGTSPDLLVLSTRGRHGAHERMLGSTAERVLTRAQAPVLAVPAAEVTAEETLAPGTARRILIPTDLSLDVEAPLESALRMAGHERSVKIYLLHAVDLPRRYERRLDSWDDFSRGALETLREHVEEAADELRATGLDVTSIVEAGDAADLILEFATGESIDLIALCSRSSIPHRRLHFGSTARRVVRDAPCCVLTISPDDSSVTAP